MNQCLVSATLRFYLLFLFSSSLFFFSFPYVSFFFSCKTQYFARVSEELSSSEEFIGSFALGHGAD